MNLLLSVLLYFVAGFFREALTVSYYRAVGRKRDYSASGLAGGIELYDFLVLAAVIRSGWNPVLLVAYTVGVMLGTFVSIRMCK
jgi:hypothetical protein